MFEGGGSFGSFFLTLSTGAVAAQASYQVSRIVDHDSLLLVGILFVIGVVVGLGHALSSRTPLPVRRIFGKVLLSTGVSVTAAAVYWYKPGTDPLVVIGLGSLLSVLGAGFLDELVRTRMGIDRKIGTDPEKLD